MELILQWISTYGYFAIFGLLVFGIVGIPVPDETLLVYSGYLIHKGKLDPAGAIAAATLGSLCGITISYIVGRTLGLGLIHRYGKWVHMTNELVERVHDWFRRAGHWALFFGYYVPGFRHVTALIAGSSGLEYRPFALFAYTGGFLWVLSFLSLGYYLGDQWEKVFGMIDHHLKIATIVAAIAVLVYLIVKWRIGRKTG
ncbi:MAG TPA: DedA family protein [Bryobacteraceae bacterium]|nr:DedA family protein [Bryobacteraceae bacterium]